MTKKSGETNPSNLQTSDIRNLIYAAGKYILAFKVDALSSVGQVYCYYVTQNGNQYVTLTSNNDTQNNIAIRTFTLTDEQVAAIKQSEELVIGIQKISSAESLTVYWAKLEEGDVSTAPNGLVQNATEALYAKKAEEAESAKSLDYGIRVSRGTSSASAGWYKIATIPYLSSASNYTYSGIILVNGEYGPQQTAYAAESGIIEVDVRVTSGAIVSATSGISVLSGNLNPAEYCLVCESDNTASLYVYIQQQYGSINFITVSENAGGLDVYAEYEDTYYGATAPTGAVYAVVRNNASSANYLTANSLSLANAIISANNNTATFNLSGIVDSGLFLAVGEHSLPDGGGYSLFFDASKTTGASCPFVFNNNTLENKIMYNASDKTIRIQVGATTNVTTSASLTLYAIGQI